MKNYLKLCVPFAILLIAACNNTVPEQGWQGVATTMQQADTGKTYNYFVEQFGKPLDEYATPSLTEEYVVYFQVPNQADSAFWVMLDTRTKNYLYWSNEKYSKETIGIRNEKLSLPEIVTVNATLPLYLDQITFSDTTSLAQLSPEKAAKIKEVILKYYFKECEGDSNETYFSVRDVYVNTIQMQAPAQTLYLVILKHIPGGQINTKLLFFNPDTKQFADQTIDFNVHALYDLGNNKLEPNELKKDLKMNMADIELIDIKGKQHYKLTRLYHNGTVNIIEPTILEIRNSKIDTLLPKTRD